MEKHHKGIRNREIKISIIIPCRNEEKYISHCLDSIIKQGYPKEDMEVLIADGMSEDDTRNIIKKYINKYPFIRLINNDKKIVSTGLNNGIREAKGDLIIRLDAHTTYPNNYIEKLVLWARESKADNVGGIWITKPGAHTGMARAIALAISHPFGIGNPYFRIGTKKPRYVDTVPFGCYRKEIFEKNGLFDEDLIRNQDDEFNLRLIKNGGKVLLVPDIISYYYARDSISKLWKMYFQYGYYKPLVAMKVGGILTWRQIIPSTFISLLILSLLLSFFNENFLWLFFIFIGIYIIVNIFISLIISMKEKDLKIILFLAGSFIAVHFSYGIGYIKGIWDFIFLKKHLKKKINDISLTR